MDANCRESTRTETLWKDVCVCKEQERKKSADTLELIVRSARIITQLSCDNTLHTLTPEYKALITCQWSCYYVVYLIVIKKRKRKKCQRYYTHRNLTSQSASTTITTATNHHCHRNHDVIVIISWNAMQIRKFSPRAQYKPHFHTPRTISFLSLCVTLPHPSARLCECMCIRTLATIHTERKW